jgi:hypothetical protein
VFFDMDTGLLLKQVNVAEGTEAVFEDFKEIHVIPIAHRWTVRTAAGKMIHRAELIEFKSEETFDDRLFQEP